MKWKITIRFYTHELKRNNMKNFSMTYGDLNLKIITKTEQKWNSRRGNIECTKNTAKNKAPGEDGLPSEFYIVFCIDIKRYLIKSYQHSYSTGMVSVTQRRGVISLIPKTKGPLNLKNWMPLSLLNQDYKLLAKLIAKRINPHLKKIINIETKHDS